MLPTNSKVLVVDVGQSVVGIRAVDGRYFAYYGNKRSRALDRLETAEEVVTYNGNSYDIPEMDKLSLQLRKKHFRLEGKHTDVKDLCWPQILGACLDDTFNLVFGEGMRFPDTYEGSNMQDVYQTLELWRYFKQRDMVPGIAT